MNCRPGDLAIVINSHPTKIHVIGVIVKVLKAASDEDRYFHPLADWVVEYGGKSNWLSCDKNLRPIRDPGEDARDETLIWKSVPSSSKEHA